VKDVRRAFRGDRRQPGAPDPVEESGACREGRRATDGVLAVTREERTMNKKLALSLVGLLVVGAATPALAGTYKLDPAHTSINFAIRHMMVSKTRGSFGDFDGWFVYKADEPQTWHAEVTIQVASIDTGNEDRDNHLRSPDFFDVEKYPTMTFEATGVDMESEDEGTLRGNLTIRDITRPIELELEILGEVTDPWGNTRAGFSAEGEIDRKDWGLTWNKSLDTGGVVVGDDVDIELEIEGILEK
jgi:polyisoprenoid-binding protein YceI